MSFVKRGFAGPNMFINIIWHAILTNAKTVYKSIVVCVASKVCFHHMACKNITLVTAHAPTWIALCYARH